MRDKNRIPLVLKEVERIWNKYPDTRFMQLIDSLKHEYSSKNETNFDLFYLEDDKFLEWLKCQKNEEDKRA